jgi:hypothetical protein
MLTCLLRAQINAPNVCPYTVDRRDQSTDMSATVASSLPRLDHQTDHQTEGLQRPDPDAAGRDTSPDLREWTNPDSVRPARWDWKSCDLQGSEGSNPSLSAAEVFTFRPNRFSRLFVAKGCIAGPQPRG